uniref:MADF domain-containing protein n=1 Tax=Stomoxys calcitrans TaxID=35570 RepID=A0A1I8P8H5_STOCA
MDTRDRIFWSEFLELYESMPCLWKVKCPEYNNRALKAKCYKRMVEKLKEVEPEATRENVVKKINVFRTNYAREMKKRKQTENYNEPFKTSLWYFDKLKFLEGVKQPVEESGEEHCNNTMFSMDDNENCTIETEIYHEFYDDTEEHSLLVTPEPATERKHIPEPKRKRRKACTPEKTNNNVLKVIPPKIASGGVGIDGFTSILAKGWESQYNELSREQKMFARTIFSDVLFHGCLNKLSEETVEEVHQVLRGNLSRTQTSTVYIRDYEEED